MHAVVKHGIPGIATASSRPRAAFAVSPLVLLAGFVAYVLYCDASARGSAEQLCGSIQAGQRVSAVRDRMTALVGDHGYLMADQGSLVAVFNAAGPRQFVCYANHAHGVVRDKGTRSISSWTR